MYRLLLYYLLALLGIALAFSATGKLQLNFLALSFSAGYLTLICLATNYIFARVFETPVNFESSYITALILALIVNPMKVPHDIVFLTAVAGLAISSKYILAIRKKHIFNPAAIAVALTALGPGQSASWWIGSITMLPFVIIGGVLIVRKIRRTPMVLTFFATALTSTAFAALLNHHAVLDNLQKAVFHSSLFFLAFVMLTEPLTSPETRDKQMWYSGLVGVLFPPQVHILSLYSTPELALVAGNIFSYIVSPKVKIMPKLEEKIMLSPDVIDFVFDPGQKFNYKPGQYMEWTLPNEHADSRGNRRYFTLASSPTEDNVRVGVKFYPDGSTYKQRMLDMDEDTPIAAGQVGGDFTLPKDSQTRLVFIAGGIGVTPYRSMLKYLVDINENRDVTLLYSEKTPDAFVYTDVFKQAQEKIDARIVYTVTGHKHDADWHGKTGSISTQMIKQEVPDFEDCLYFISGPHQMVVAMRDILKDLGIHQAQIKTDYFTGYT